MPSDTVSTDPSNINPPGTGALDERHLKANMRKVALTALAGTSIEWYDFFLYATAAALVFPAAFFREARPPSD